MFTRYIIMISLIFIISCKDSDQTNELSEKNAPPSTGMSTDMVQRESAGEQQSAPSNENMNFYNQDKRMIIRSGSASIEVDKYDEAEAKVKEIAARYSGYITNTTSSTNIRNKKQGTITVRIPADKFEALLGELSNIGKVMNQNIQGDDVTEEFMDAEARLKTQRELETRLLTLLAEKTAKLTDIVEVETKLAQVRENIERIEGRIRFLKDQSSFSTLNISLYEYSIIETSSGGGFFYELGEAVKRGLKGFTGVLSGIITVSIALVPLLIIFAIIFYLIRKYLIKRKTVSSK